MISHKLYASVDDTLLTNGSKVKPTQYEDPLPKIELRMSDDSEARDPISKWFDTKKEASSALQLPSQPMKLDDVSYTMLSSSNLKGVVESLV